MVDDEKTDELNPNDPAVRELRANAEERAERVLAGEEPWRDEEAGDQEAADAGYDAVAEPADEDVGETTSPGPDVVNPEEVAVNDEG